MANDVKVTFRNTDGTVAGSSYSQAARGGNRGGKTYQGVRGGTTRSKRGTIIGRS